MPQNTVQTSDPSSPWYVPPGYTQTGATPSLFGGTAGSTTGGAPTGVLNPVQDPTTGQWSYPAGQPLMTGGDYTGMPDIPGFNNPYNPSTMSMEPFVQQQLSGINLDPMEQSVQNFANLADRVGPSAWATQAGQQQNQIAQNTEDQNAQTAAGQTAGAMDQLASSGGMTSGARDRVAEQGTTNMMNMDQGTERQNSMNQMQIGVNDQQNKMQEMGMLPGMESQALQPQFQEAGMLTNAFGQDVSNQMNATNALNNYNMGIYQTGMQGWGDQQTASQQQPSGSWLCTEALTEEAKKEWKALRKLKVFSARKNKEVTAFYLYCCSPLIERMKKGGADWGAVRLDLQAIARTVADGLLDEAYFQYYCLVKYLIQQYWPDCPHPVYTRAMRNG